MKGKKIKVSVIIPVYNSEKYIKDCLNSVLYQTLDGIEVILVNDGSKDDSQKIIDEYILKNENIKCLVQENSGQAVARNNGIKMAEGEYIEFLDSDDYLESTSLEKAYNYAKCNSLDIVCFNFYEVNESDKNIKIKSKYYKVQNSDNVKKYILNETSPCNKLIKTELLKNSNLKFLENHIYEDLAFIPTLALETNKIGFIDEYLHNYLIRENSTMRKPQFEQKLKDIYGVMDALYGRFLNTKYKSELEYLYIEHLLHGASLRFFNYREGIGEVDKIVQIIKEKFPEWRKNVYYKKFDIKYKIICNLIYYKKFNLVKKLLKIEVID